MLLRGVLDATVVQVAVKAGLVNSIHGAESHRHGGELPEFGHAVGVRVRRHTALWAGYFLAEAIKVVFRESAL